MCTVQLHQVSSKLDEKQKRFINSPFFCLEFQSVRRIVKIGHSAIKVRYFQKIRQIILLPFWQTLFFSSGGLELAPQLSQRGSLRIRNLAIF